jgi:hypothetical protein
MVVPTATTMDSQLWGVSVTQLCLSLPHPEAYCPISNAQFFGNMAQTSSLRSQPA